MCCYSICAFSIFLGSSNLMLLALYAADKTEIKNMNITINDHVKEKGIKIPKFLLLSKPFDFGLDGFSDDSDFEVSFTKAPATSTPKLEERRELINEQDKAYELSLKADQLKNQLFQIKKDNEKEKEAWEKLKEQEKCAYLKQLQEERKRLVPEEPSLSQDCSVITIHHISLGRKTRQFPSNRKMEFVYNWVGSLNDQPELFELLVCLPAATVVDPDAVVSDFEKNILYMKKVADSNFTINIQMQNEADKQMTHCSKNNDCGDKNLYRLICPLCSKPFPAEEIKKHASDCAASKYRLVIESDISDDSDMELPVLWKERRLLWQTFVNH